MPLLVSCHYETIVQKKCSFLSLYLLSCVLDSIHPDSLLLQSLFLATMIPSPSIVSTVVPLCVLVLCHHDSIALTVSFCGHCIKPLWFYCLDSVSQWFLYLTVVLVPCNHDFIAPTVPFCGPCILPPWIYWPDSVSQRSLYLVIIILLPRHCHPVLTMISLPSLRFTVSVCLADSSALILLFYFLSCFHIKSLSLYIAYCTSCYLYLSLTVTVVSVCHVLHSFDLIVGALLTT